MQVSASASAFAISFTEARFLGPHLMWLIEIGQVNLNLKIRPAQLVLDRKFNFKAGLFSSIFLFERIFGCKTALLVFWPLRWENGPESAQN